MKNVRLNGLQYLILWFSYAASALHKLLLHKLKNMRMHHILWFSYAASTLHKLLLHKSYGA